MSATLRIEFVDVVPTFDVQRWIKFNQCGRIACEVPAECFDKSRVRRCASSW